MSPLLLAAALCAFDDPTPGIPAPFVIEVRDEQTGRGVPLVELRTTNEVKYITDSAGVVAIVDPDLMNQKIFFHVFSHGYEFPKDGFDFAGKAIEVKPGGKAELRVKRVNIAERIYRNTGGGIYRDTVMAGRTPPIEQPLLNAQVFGQDSVVTGLYNNRVYWFWGDTNRPSYPLGNFHTPGATSPLPGPKGLDPEVGINLDYFTNPDGFAKPTCQMPGEGPTWIGGLVVFKEGGRERMFACYAKIKGYLTAYERGIVEWDHAKNEWRKVKTIPIEGKLRPEGHTFRHREGETDYVYFATPYPLTRVRDSAAAYLDTEQYEAYTCLNQGSTLENPQFDRDHEGRLRYTWKRDAPAVGTGEQADLVKRGLLKQEEGLLQLRDVETGKRVLAHGGSVNWNQHRKRWVMIAVEMGGTSSLLGEVWYAEADHPEGPWTYARKVVTHDKYSFYNPRHHAFLDRDGGRTIYFEGTYTSSFSGNPVQTPRYDYNQIMYKLNLDDAGLRLADGNERHQAFDTDPGWEGHNNRPAAGEMRSISQDFGYSRTTHIDSTPGEIGGFVTPAAEPAFCAKVLRPLTFNDRFKASGKLACADGPFHALLGFFNNGAIAEWRTPNSVALRLNGRGDRFFAFVEYATSKWRAGGDSPRPFPMHKNQQTGRDEFEGFRCGATVHTWSLAFDPDANDGNGAVTATMDDATAVCNLEPGHKQDGATFNRFGILNVVKSADTGGTLWIDDVTINGVHEDFREDPRWHSFQNSRTYETTNIRPRWDCGFSTTNHAGGQKPGEIGGRIFRSDCRHERSLAYYADRLETLSLERPIHASGQVALRRGVSDSTVLIGFFHNQESVRVNESQKSGLPRSFLGIAVDGPSRDGFYFAPALRVSEDGHFFDFAQGPPVIMPDGTSHTWDLQYDPSAGAHGRIMLTFDGKSVSLDLSESDRKSRDSFNRFGFVSTWVDGNAQSIYLDDLSYTWRHD